jgi:trk system potassium uptake protein TrkA
MQHQNSELIMRYLIVGCGRVGSTLAKLLDADGHEVVVVDENPAAFKRLGQKFKGHVVVGTGIDYDLLKRAGAASAQGFIAVTNGDNRNIMAAMIAQRMFHIKKIVARIYDPTRGMMYRDLGIDTVCPTTIGAKMIRDMLMESPWDTLQSFDFGKVTSLTAVVPAAGAGRRVSELERPGCIRIAAVRTGKTVRVASEDTILAEGDEINAIVAPEGISEFRQHFNVDGSVPAAEAPAH